MVGVVGIGFGLWWADAVAAIVIGADILHDGVRYTRAAMQDLLDGHPRRYDEKGVHPLVDDVRRTVAELDWAECAAVRMRELGHVFSVEVLVVPRDDADLPRRTDEAIRTITELDWKLSDVVVTAVPEIEDAPPGVVVDAGGGQA
jgi:divalent metal cation (Fe/Co/Zn/Cd) transporter